MKSLVTAVVFAAASLASGAAKADQAALVVCIEKFKSVGLSADLAYGECKKSSLGDCIKGLVGTSFVARSVEKKPQGYLIDLGNSDSRWLEGGGWRELGCQPYADGPKRRQQTITAWGFDSVNQWFRQGICQNESVQLKQAYTPEDAKLACEIQELGVSKKSD
jgi:hypothetical protein